MPTAIAEYRFAYSARVHETRMEPPPDVPLLSDLPKALSDAFETSFGQIGASRCRPTAAEWVSLLERAEQEVVTCKTTPAHDFFRSAASCPWCRMEAAYPGFIAFIPHIPLTSATPVNLAHLIAAIRGVPDPGTAPELSTSMPAFSGAATPISANMRHLALVYAAGLIAIFAVVVSLRLEVLPSLSAFLLTGAGAFLAVRQPKALEALEKTVSQATTAWRNLESNWQQVRDNRAFLTYRGEADEIIRQLQRLPIEENKEIADLKTKQHDAQLTMFLQRFYIDRPNTKIKGVGSSRKIMLRSYGIETAADVQQTRIQHINGFGPVITGAIVAWRKSLERRFVFNPNQPIDPSAVATIKAKIAGQHFQLQKRLQGTLTELQRSSTQLLSVRAHLRNAALSLWQAKRQADVDAATYLKIFSRRNRIIAIGLASCAALLLPLSSIRPIATSFPGRDQISRNESLTSARPYGHSASNPAGNFTVPAPSVPSGAGNPQSLPSAPSTVDSAAREAHVSLSKSHMPVPRGAFWHCARSALTGGPRT
jgi:DNA-binding helix-hairpin-helix protein with protein kinase domain